MTRAVTLAEIADTNTFIVDGTNNRVGIGSSSPTTTLDVNGIISGDGSGLTNVGIGTTGSINTSGIVTATAFYGDGSNLEGVTTSKQLTIGVRVGAAVTFEVVGAGFTVDGRSAEITIDV